QNGIGRVGELAGCNQIASTRQKLVVATEISGKSVLKVVVELFRQPSSCVAKFGHVLSFGA
ncbi:hypothetical protein QCE80_15075, partial [Staphylococcus aureus]|nr:hypothetical protein [Staphylococcus aureus]